MHLERSAAQSCCPAWKAGFMRILSVCWPLWRNGASLGKSLFPCKIPLASVWQWWWSMARQCCCSRSLPEEAADMKQLFIQSAVEGLRKMWIWDSLNLCVWLCICEILSMFSHSPLSIGGIWRCPYTCITETQEPALAVEFSLNMGQGPPWCDWLVILC